MGRYKLLGCKILEREIASIVYMVLCQDLVQIKMRSSAC